MPHKCHAVQCSTAVAPQYLMCPMHWRMVPKHLQQPVYAAYRPSQIKDMTPSTAWWKAADAAIVHVALLERKLTQDEAEKYLESREEFYARWGCAMPKAKGFRRGILFMWMTCPRPSIGAALMLGHLIGAIRGSRVEPTYRMPEGQNEKE